jgi:hypothetical protein
MTTIVDRLDGLSSSTAIKAACRVATTANITLQNEQTIDGVAVVTGDRVLVKNQTTASENGIWIVDTGYWGRARDFDSARDYALGTRIYVRDGTAGRGEYEVTDLDPMTISVGVTPASAYASAVSASASAATATAAAATATAAASSVGDASGYAIDALASATAAATSAGIATAQATNAATSATDAAYWASQAQAIAGGATDAAVVTVTPTGNISSTDVQAALAELDTEKQAVDADLTALAALSSTGIAVRTASNTWAQRTISGGNGVAVTNGSGAAGNPTLALDFTNPSSDTTLAGTEQVLMSDGGTIKRTTAQAIANLAATNTAGRRVLISTTTVVSGDAEEDIALPDTGYNAFEVEYYGLTNGTSSFLYARVRVDGDASVKSGASDYFVSSTGFGTAGTGYSSSTRPEITLTYTASSTLARNGSFRLTWGGSYGLLTGTCAFSPVQVLTTAVMQFAGPYDLLRLYPSSGTFTAGIIRLYGYTT